MIANILVAGSNVFGLCPIMRSYQRQDYITTGAIGFVTGASFLSHLIENHKHGMPGLACFGFSTNTSYFLNRLDILGCILVSCRLGYLYLKKHSLSLRPILNSKYLLIGSLFALSLNLISEYDKYNINLKGMYIMTHICWHTSIFLIIDKFLQNIIYQ